MFLVAQVFPLRLFKHYIALNDYSLLQPLILPAKIALLVKKKKIIQGEHVLSMGGKESHFAVDERRKVHPNH